MCAYIFGDSRSASCGFSLRTRPRAHTHPFARIREIEAFNPLVAQSVDNGELGLRRVDAAHDKLMKVTTRDESMSKPDASFLLRSFARLKRTDAQRDHGESFLFREGAGDASPKHFVLRRDHWDYRVGCLYLNIRIAGKGVDGRSVDHPLTDFCIGQHAAHF